MLHGVLLTRCVATETAAGMMSTTSGRVERHKIEFLAGAPLALLTIIFQSGADKFVSLSVFYPDIELFQKISPWLLPFADGCKL